MSDVLVNLTLELRRGALVLAVLSQLKDEQYGYALLQKLEKKKFIVEPGTLYPLLRRLEKQGLLKSAWDTSKSRPRKFYILSSEGLSIYHDLCLEWKGLVEGLSVLISD